MSTRAARAARPGTGPRAAFEAVVFDCDGVLVDSEGIAGEVWAEMAAELDGGAGGAPAAVLPDGAAALRRFRGERFSDCAAWLEGALGRPLPPGFERDFRARSARRFARELEPVPGVAEVLASLRAHAVPFSVASNGPRAKTEANLGTAGFLALFEGRVFSAYELEVWKPDPRFYREVAARLGVPPARCAVVEDSLPGVRAALGAGAAAFAYVEPEDAPACTALGARVFHDMAALPALLLGVGEGGRRTGGGA